VSRSLERAGPSAYADSVVADVITCPLGHKYEVLGIWMLGPGTNGSTTAIYLHVTAGYVFAALDLGGPDPFYLRRYEMNNLVLYEGESLSVVAYNAPAAAYSVYLDYIDVDYST